MEMLDDLENLPFFKEFEYRDIATLCNYLERVEVPARTEVLTEGKNQGKMLITYEGRLVIASKGRETDVKLSTKGIVIGEMAFFDRQPHSATITTETKASLLELSRESYDRLVAEHPGIALKFLTAILETVSIRLRNTKAGLSGYMRVIGEYFQVKE